MPTQLATPPKNIVYVTDKSGGHIIPCLTHAQRKTKHSQLYRAYTFTSGSPLENTLTAQMAFPHFIPQKLRKMPKVYDLLQWPFFLYELHSYFFTTLVYFTLIQPQKIISFGGLTSLPVCFAAWINSIPITLYELNVIPGKATSLLSYFAQKIYTCFTQAQQYFKHAKVAPYPIRFTNKDLQYNQKKIKQKNNLNPNKKTIVILGGSQGAQELNTLVPQSLTLLPKDIQNTIEIIHQTGYNSEAIKQTYESYNIPAHCKSYFHNIIELYQAADLIISRSGAGSLFEIQHFQKPCITIPLCNQAKNHQLHNAQAFSKANKQFHMLVQPTKKELAHCMQALLAQI